MKKTNTISPAGCIFSNQQKIALREWAGATWREQLRALAAAMAAKSIVGATSTEVVAIAPSESGGGSVCLLVGVLLSIACLVWLGMKLFRRGSPAKNRHSNAQTTESDHEEIKNRKAPDGDRYHRWPEKLYVTQWGECVHCSKDCKGLNCSRTVQEKRRCSVCFPA